MVECILWDFGDTLADERWMTEAPALFSNWPTLYRQHVWEGPLGDDWNTGKVTTNDVAVHLAQLLAAETEYVITHMKRRCADLTFFKNAMAAARSSKLPQAIVTINTDIFSQQVVPNYRLDQLAKVIVTSWQERTLDKSDLCDIALKRLGHTLGRAQALLIDNRIENVESWRARGGTAYHFTGDEEFANFGPADLVGRPQQNQ